MTERKSFRVKKDDRPPLEFDLTWEQDELDEDQKPTGRTKDYTEVFHASPSVPGTLMLDLVASANLEPSYQAAAFTQFISESLVEDDRDKFFNAIKKMRPAVDVAQLSEITNWLVEQYGERPTSSATPS